MTDNVDIFKKIVFSLPGFRNTFSAVIVLGFLYSFLTYLSIQTFTFLDLSPISMFFLALLGFILPAAVSGELLYRFLPDYPRRWGYFLALSNETILFVYGLILSGADSFSNAWHVFWIALITVCLANFFVLLLTIGYDYVGKISTLSAVQPLLVLCSFHLFIGSYLHIPLYDYIINLGILFVAGAVLLAAFTITEYLIRANLDNVSVLQLTSGLLQKKQEALELGYPTNPDVQTLAVSNRDGSATLVVPWIHPGPLEGFGGGRITSNIIRELNEEGTGFFLHVPSTHKSDPTDPEDYRKIMEAIEEPEKVGDASRLVRESYGSTTFYGRKVNGRKIVFMEADEYDDYELPIFRESIDPEKTLIVDLHNQDREEDNRKEAWYNTKSSRELRENFSDFLEELEGQEKEDYSAGFAAEPGSTPVYAMVEEVDGQRTLLFGIEGNGSSGKLRDLREEYLEQFDEVMLFSTDTHRSIHQLSSKEVVDTDRVRETVQRAVEDVSPASIGFTNSTAATMDLLQEDYSGLIFSINILIRLILLTFAILYLVLVAWIWF
ncbi:MAG: DUF2070 family protein [Candidatus Nanohaloarchaea archaeon]